MSFVSSDINGQFKKYIDIIIERQLLDEKLWAECVNVFSSGIDNNDAGWRGEYWGKMMRGACLIYQVNPSQQLLDVLTNAVIGLLSKQDEYGRITTYRSDEEFFGWDMWVRKYVMTGLQHYYDICPDEELKNKIISALVLHADYITDKIGENKISILETGQFWGGVNSASILEPFVRLYKDTGKQKYLDFAKYIISTGGCRDGNLLDCAMRNVPVFCYPEQKAYETMSFFEGILAYYEVTGEKEYLEAVIKFTDSVLKDDVTVIGSSGCTHELFDCSSIRQTEKSEKIMQETCVTVTLMRLLSRLYNTTGNKRLIDTIQISAINALSGALNINGYDQYCRERREYIKGMLFDSYSPLCNSKRGLGIGGYKEFADGTYFGCCACIASAGFALYPLMCITQKENVFSINYILNGEYTFTLNNGEKVEFSIFNDRIKIKTKNKCHLIIKVTGGNESLSITALSENKGNTTEDGLTVFDGEWYGEDEIKLSVSSKLFVRTLNQKTSFSYGGYVLAADESKNEVDFSEKISFSKDKIGNIIYSVCKAEDDEQIRITTETDKGVLVLTDYASSGQDGKSRISVWF